MKPADNQKEPSLPATQILAEAKQNDSTEDITLNPANADIFTVTTKLRTTGTVKSLPENSGKWAERINTTIPVKNKGTKSNDLRLSSTDNQMDSNSMERLNSVIEIGKQRLVDYDPVNMLEDFNTQRF